MSLAQTQQTHVHEVHKTNNGSVFALAAGIVGAIGVVYGDIGTSPLYAMQQALRYVPVNEDNVLGIVSSIFWALTILVTTWYIFVVLKISHNGQGGIPALLKLLKHKLSIPIVIIGLFGVALLFGDGVITPAISVLSAVEGLQHIVPVPRMVIVIVTISILIGLFWLQQKGTGKIGTLFGPIMISWFLTLGGFGLVSLLHNPGILAALNPLYAIKFIGTNLPFGLSLGAITLAFTGCEAVYADLGHFGPTPIRASWLGLIYPCLVLNYMGQGAAILGDHRLAEKAFYSIVPEWATMPVFVLSTLATVIASQALISGAFSLTVQLTTMKNMPEFQVIHTGDEGHPGQIYIPEINWALAGVCVWIVMQFQSSDNLAAAYGLAVLMAMGADAIVFWNAATKVKGWARNVTTVGVGAILAILAVFLVANSPKVMEGGYLPLIIATTMTIFMVGNYRRLKKRSKEMKRLNVRDYATTANPPENVVRLGLIFVGDIVSCVTSKQDQLMYRRRRGEPYRFVHIAREDDGTRVKSYLMNEMGIPEDNIDIIQYPSGDLRRALDNYIDKKFKEYEAEGKFLILNVSIGQPITKGTAGLTPSARHLIAALDNQCEKRGSVHFTDYSIVPYGVNECSVVVERRPAIQADNQVVAPQKQPVSLR